MKKVMLSAAALIFAAGMSAQTATPPPAPTQAQAVTNNSGDPDANMGESVQNGNGNKVRVQQAGTNQRVYTMQDDGTGSGANQAWIMQTGAVSALSGVENEAEVLQSGTENQAWTKQEGDFNDALTRQGQSITASSGNKARIRQGTGQNAEGNSVGIDQDGDDNQAWTRQTYDNSNAYTKQLGDNNNSYINQNAGPNQTDGHGAEVRQTGDMNESWVYQSGNGARNEAVTEQVGDGNKAIQTQVNTALASGTKNEALISQISSVYSGNQGALLSDLSNQQPATLSGAGIGVSYDGIAFQSQTGSGNDAEAFQGGAASEDSNYSEQEQNGNGNTGVIFQNATVTSTGGGNYAKQLQVGDNNIAGIAQGGVNHKAYQRQLGNDNKALSTQMGSHNLVNTYQGGNNNWAATAQAGQDNQILVVQKGGHSYSVSQNLADGMSNGGNVADILQLGPNGNFATDGENCVFDPQLTPPPSINIPNFNIDQPCPPGGC